MSLILSFAFHPFIVSSIFIFLSIFVDSSFFNIYFYTVLFSLLPIRLILLSPSTSKLSVLEGQFNKIDGFFSPILNSDIGLSILTSSAYIVFSSWFIWIFVFKYPSVWLRLLRNSFTERGSGFLKILSFLLMSFDKRSISKVLGGFKSLQDISDFADFTSAILRRFSIS